MFIRIASAPPTATGEKAPRNSSDDYCLAFACAGVQMRDRIIGALETGCRLGEMLKVQNRHVLWDTQQISNPAAREGRRIATHSV
jgi:hypothetical protein